MLHVHVSSNLEVFHLVDDSADECYTLETISMQPSTLTETNPLLLTKTDPANAHGFVRWARNF